MTVALLRAMLEAMPPDWPVLLRVDHGEEQPLRHLTIRDDEHGEVLVLADG